MVAKLELAGFVVGLLAGELGFFVVLDGLFVLVAVVGFLVLLTGLLVLVCVEGLTVVAFLGGNLVAGTILWVVVISTVLEVVDSVVVSVVSC